MEHEASPVKFEAFAPLMCICTQRQYFFLFKRRRYIGLVLVTITRARTKGD